MTVGVQVDPAVAVAEVDPRFLSVAVDSSQVVGGHWWGASGEVEIGVGAELVDPYDFTRPRLRRLARELAPALIRIGGTEADKIFYDLSGSDEPEVPEPYAFAMTRDQWDEMADFADEVGYEILFTLNAGPGPRDAANRWTDDNARLLVEHAVDREDPVAVWELGNEINGFLVAHFFHLGGAAYARDVATARTLVDELDPDALLAGPSSAFWPRIGSRSPCSPTSWPREERSSTW